MGVTYLTTIAQGQEGGVQCSITHLSTRKNTTSGYLFQESHANIMRRGQMTLPDLPAFRGFRWSKVDDDIEATQKSGVNTVARVGRDNYDAFVVLQALQQVVGFEIGIAVVGVAYFGTFRHEGITFVK